MDTTNETMTKLVAMLNNEFPQVAVQNCGTYVVVKSKGSDATKNWKDIWAVARFCQANLPEGFAIAKPVRRYGEYRNVFGELPYRYDTTNVRVK